MQTFQDWECIIVGGASKDETLIIVEEYERLDERFRHISELDKGDMMRLIKIGNRKRRLGLLFRER